MTELTHDKLKEMLHYDPASGVFTWLVSRGSVKPGSSPKARDTYGYPVIRIFKRLYRAHRIAWFYMTGEMPKFNIDHRNGNTTDNSWVNLRDCTQSQNIQNGSIRSDNTSGVRGVTVDNTRGKFVAALRLNGKKYCIGRFDSLSDATEARVAAELRLHGEFSPLVSRK